MKRFAVLLLLLLGVGLAACQATVKAPPEVTAPQTTLDALPQVDLAVGFYMHPAARRYIIAPSWAQFHVGQNLEATADEYLPRSFKSVRKLGAFPPPPEIAAQLDAVVVVNSVQGKMGRPGLATIRLNIDAEFSLYTPDGEQIAISRSASSAEVFFGAGSPSDNIQKAYEAAELVAGGVVLNFLRDMPVAKLTTAAAAYRSALGPAGLHVATQSKGLAPTPSYKPVDVNFLAGRARPDDVAVIIGNADYGKLGRDIPNVPPAYADAAGMRLYVVKALGVRDGNVIDLRDATGAQMQRVFGTKDDPKGQLYDWVRPERSRVFVCYAGHGAPLGVDGSSYLVPSDADAARIQLNGYPLSTLYHNLSKLPAQHVTVVLEACFSGASQAGSVISKASPVFVKPRAEVVPRNLTVISAAAPEQLASWEQDGEHSLFTSYFLKGMAGAADVAPYGDGNGTVTTIELQNYLSDTLTYYARRYYGRDQTAQFFNAR